MFNYKDKVTNLRVLNNYMLAKTLSMFEWENLPITIPYKELEKLLQVNGFAFITKFNNELYAFNGALGGEQDAYGNPTKFIISNPHLKFNETLDVEKDGVLIYNDDLAMGLIPLLDRYNTFLVENDINMMMYGYNSRTQKLISASDDKTRASAQLAVKKAIDGDIEVIGESIIFDGVKVHSGSANNGLSITNLTEFHQYIKGTLFNELGLSANFNMKRERLTAGEAEMGDDSNYPFIYNMLKCRLKAIEKINEMFGADIKIQFGSVWAKTSNEVIDDKINPSADPELDPSADPEQDPSADPELDPSADPEQDPSADPELDPSADPSADPEQDPSADPELDPSADPSADPELDPSADPELDPSADPEQDPSADPELDPSADPEQDPSADPELDPSADPSADPEQDPSADPELDPSADPSADPEQDPSADPELDPSADPEQDPSADPEQDPSADPELDPSADPEQDPEQDPELEADKKQALNMDQKIEALKAIIEDPKTTDEEKTQAEIELQKLEGE